MLFQSLFFYSLVSVCTSQLIGCTSQLIGCLENDHQVGCYIHTILCW